MRTVPKWVNKIHEADKVEFSRDLSPSTPEKSTTSLPAIQPPRSNVQTLPCGLKGNVYSVNSICFSPDGTQLVIGAGEKVMVYDPQDGALIQLLQAHKGTVHAVAYCGDGKKFASGSADKNVIIWTSRMEGVLKYSHSESIQCLAYNPVTYYLVSCALTDFAFWSMDVKAVQKYRVSGRITSCAWSWNGLYLAIGLASGIVSIRDKTGEEIQRLARDAAVWAVAFSKNTLLVTDWNETLSFYNIMGQSVYKEKNIGIAALSISQLGSMVVVGGAGGWAAVTADGVPVVSTRHDWVWAVAPSPAFNTLAVACQDGTLWCYQVVFSTVHGLYRERYAYRENMTEVIVQHLTSGHKVRIKCHDRVHKIAIYKHRLAVQLPERVVVYEQGDVEGMLYRVKEKLPQKSECSLLVATSDALLICQDAKLTMIGRRIPKSWTMPAPIRYVKVTTLCFQEVLLLGLMNGQIWQVEPVEGKTRVLVQSAGIVRCLDVSASRGAVAAVDDAATCRVYSLATGDLMYSEDNVSSVSWNSCCDELLAMSGGGRLSIKAGSFPPASHPLSGSVVGFQGGRVFCLQANAMQTVQVPLSHAVHQYIQQKMFSEAYAVACLGVTALDWERLGVAALEELSFEVARKAFQRSENVLYLTLIDQLQERVESGEKRAVVTGEVLAYRGRYADAARAFVSAAREDKALNMYVDLRMFNKAQEYVDEGEGLAALARRRAEWARHVNDSRAAAEMYLAAGDVKRAAQLMAETGRRDMLIELARKLDKGSSESLKHVAEALVQAGEPTAAADVYQRLGDYSKVAQVVVSANEWTRAFALAREHPECKRDVYLPYAHRMASESKFVEAQKAYHMAGETETAMRVFTVLVGNAVAEERFSDAGYLHHLLATQCLEAAAAAPAGEGREAHARRHAREERTARVYHAYDAVHRCVHEPFSLTPPDALLNAARYVLALLDDEPPPGVSIFCLYLCVAKQAKALNAHNLAGTMLDKIQALQTPHKFQESVELLIVKTRARGSEGASSRDEDVSPLCWRCRRHGAPLAAARCAACRHLISHSLATHEVLPLVQFVPAEGISHEEALELISRMPLPEAEADTTGPEVLRLDDDPLDPFLDKVDEDDDSGVVVCSRSALLQLNPVSVVVVHRAPLAPLLYRNMLPELPVTACVHCHNLFYLEDYEIQVLTKGQCPFCRHPVEDGSLEDDHSLNNESAGPSSPSNGHSWR